MNTRRSFLATLAFGVASIAAGALKYTPEPIRKSKLFGTLDGSIGQWSDRILHRNMRNQGSSLMGLLQTLKNDTSTKSETGALITCNWFERK